MSYVVFALKWRPKNFDEIIGQGHIVSTLKSAIEKGRLAHAYLFAGPRGVGKTSAARILAKALNCKEAKGFDPCGKCSSCLEISQGRSMDVIEIDGASNRGIDEIRALRENVKFSPVSGKYKVYIIDEVHQITPDGFNALLKTLEEPPEFVKFIFATTHPHKVIPTILSRCQRLDFRRIPLLEIISQLERIVKAEKISVDKEVLLAIAKSSDGSLRDAESVLDQMVSFSKDKISLDDVISVLGLVEQEVLFDLTDKIIKKDAKAALGLFNRIIDEGKDISSFLGNLIEHFRNLMVAKVANADSKLIDLPQDICDHLVLQAREFTLEEIFIAFNILVNTQEMSKRLESMRIPLEISLVKLANDKKGALQSDYVAPVLKEKSPVHVLDKPVKIHEKNVVEPAAPVKTTLPEDLSLGAKGMNFEKISSSWQGIIEALSKVTMSLSTYLSEGTLVGMEGNALTVAFPRNCSLHKESLEDRENKVVIEKVAAGLCGGAVRFNFILSDQIKDKADDPVLREALKTFNGRVVKEESNG